MSSVEKDIVHDHVYLSSFATDEDCNQARGSLTKPSNTSRRAIRKKDDIQTEEDRQAYFRRRKLNNASCRISRIHRRSKFDLMSKKCTEYEDLNARLTLQESVLFEVINRLKEHLRSLVSDNPRPN